MSGHRWSGFAEITHAPVWVALLAAADVSETEKFNG